MHFEGIPAEYSGCSSVFVCKMEYLTFDLTSLVDTDVDYVCQETLRRTSIYQHVSAYIIFQELVRQSLLSLVLFELQPETTSLEKINRPPFDRRLM